MIGVADEAVIVAEEGGSAAGAFSVEGCGGGLVEAIGTDGEGGIVAALGDAINPLGGFDADVFIEDESIGIRSGGDEAGKEKAEIGVVEAWGGVVVAGAGGE